MSSVSSNRSLRRRAARALKNVLGKVAPARGLNTGFVGLEALESRTMLSATLQLSPSVTPTMENGLEVVTVAPGATINFTAALANGSDPTKSFQLDFSNTNPNLTLSGWTTNGAWATNSNPSLGVGDSVVAASNGSALTAPTLGTFTVTAPSTPGDYSLTANADTIFSGSLYYTLFINRVAEAIEEGPFPSFDGFQVTSVNVTSVNGGRTTDPVATQDYQNIFKIDYTYNPVTQVFTTSAPQFIAQTLGADGIIQANNGADLIIGGQANQVFEVPSGGGTVQTANLPSGESFHVAMDPSGTSIWTSDEPGSVLLNVPLSNFGSNITALNVTGDEVTQLGFAPALTAMNSPDHEYAYYTKSNRDGGAGDDGSWGIIDLDTGVATPVQSNIDGPHSIIFDSYSGDMIMVGDHTITQVNISNPMSPTVASIKDVSTQLDAVAVDLKFTGTATVQDIGSVPVNNFDSGEPLSVLDQAAVDGLGHLFVATNSGYAVVLDYSNNTPSARLVENGTVAIDPGTSKLPFVAEYLDDFSPVVNPTSQGGTILTAGDNSGISIANFGDVIVRVAAPVLPTVTIAASDATASESSGDTGTITVTRTGATDAALPVSYTIGGTAANGTDYATITGSVTIPVGQSSADITITPIDQHIVGGSKTALLTLSTDPTYTIGDSSAATVTINDDDAPPVLSTVTIAATDPNASESTQDTGTFTVTRTTPTDADLQVLYQIGGTATNGTDDATLSGSVTIPAGQTSATITVTPIDVHIDGGSKTVALTLSDNAAYTVGTPASDTVTIADDDQPAPVLTATAAITSQQLDATHYRYTITLHNTGNTTVGTFWYAWLPNEDFLPVQPTNIVSPTGWTGQVFPGASSGYSIQWKATTDGADLAAGDSLTTFQFDSTATPAQIAGDSSSFSGTPIDTSAVYTGQPLVGTEFDFVVDSSGFDLTAPTVTVNKASGQVDPAVTPPINFTVVFDEPVTDFTTGNVSFTGSTAAGTLLGTVTQIAPNDGTTYNVAVTGMTSSGTVVATVAAGVAHDTSGNPNAASSSSDNSVTFNQVLPVVTITATDSNASESTLDTGTFTVTRTGPTDADLQVLYQIGGTATNGTDDAALSGSVTIPAGQTSATITVTPIDVNIVGGSKTVILTLSDNAAYTVGTPATDTVTIADDDVAPVLPVAAVTGNGQAIADGSVTTGTANATDFGSVNQNDPPVTETYTITNSGVAALVITDSVTATGGFTVTQPLSTNIDIGDSTTFTVTLPSGTINSFSGTVSIPTNDPNNSFYTFKVTGNIVSAVAADNTAIAADTAKIATDKAALKTKIAADTTNFNNTTKADDLNQIAEDQQQLKDDKNPANGNNDPETLLEDSQAIAEDQAQLANDEADLKALIALDTATSTETVGGDTDQLNFDKAKLALDKKGTATPAQIADLTALRNDADKVFQDNLATFQKIALDTNNSGIVDDQDAITQAKETLASDSLPFNGDNDPATLLQDRQDIADAMTQLTNDQAALKAQIALDTAAGKEAVGIDNDQTTFDKTKLTLDQKGTSTPTLLTDLAAVQHDSDKILSDGLATTQKLAADVTNSPIIDDQQAITDAKNQLADDSLHDPDNPIDPDAIAADKAAIAAAQAMLKADQTTLNTLLATDKAAGKVLAAADTAQLKLDQKQYSTDVKNHA